MSELELRDFFKFNEADLSANRKGRLSEKQSNTIQEGSAKVKRYGVGIGVGLILIAAAISYGIYSQVGQGGTSLVDVIGGMITVCLIFGVFALISFWVAFVKIDLTLANVVGKVNFIKVEKTERTKSATGSTHTRTVQVYELRVGDVKFHNVPEKLLNWMEEGDIYAVYFLKASNHILSLERISKGN